MQEGIWDLKIVGRSKGSGTKLNAYHYLLLAKE